MRSVTPSTHFSPAAGPVEHNMWVVADCPSGPDGKRLRIHSPGNASCIAANGPHSRQAIACCASAADAMSPVRAHFRRQPTCPRICPKRPITDVDGAFATWGEARAECLAQGRSLCTRSQIEEGGGCSFVRVGGGGPLWTRSPCGGSPKAPTLEYAPINHMPPQCKRVNKYRLADYANLSLGGCIQHCEGTTDCATVAYHFITRDCRLLQSCDERVATDLTLGRCEYAHMLQARQQLNDMVSRRNLSVGSPQGRRFQWCHYTRRATVSKVRAFNSTAFPTHNRSATMNPMWHEVHSWYTRPADPTREAYATVWCGVASSAYFDGFKVLLHTIRQQDVLRPIIVLTQSVGSGCAPAADIPQLERLAMRHAPLSYEHVSFPVRNRACLGSIKGQMKGQNGRPSREGLTHMFLKFALWNLTRYHRIVCIDSDSMVLRSLEMLWAMPLGADEDSTFDAAAVMTIVAERAEREKVCLEDGRAFGNRKFNTGLLVIKPNATFYQRALQTLSLQRRGHMSCSDGDQGPYNSLFRQHTRCISHSFNCYDPHYITNHSADRANQSDCIEPGADMPHIVHFAMTTKPWHPSRIKLQRTSLFYQMWARAIS